MTARSAILLLLSTQALACAVSPVAQPPAPLGQPGSAASPSPSADAPQPTPSAAASSSAADTGRPPGVSPQPAMKGPGCPGPQPERPAAPPDRKVFGKCAYYLGCPKAAPSPPIPVCPADLEIVSVRALRSEGARRAKGSPIAIRGRAQWQRRLGGAVGIYEEGTVGVGPPPCEGSAAVLYLATDDPGPCYFAGADFSTAAGALGCHGDLTDRCCRANPGFPPIDSVVVVIGRYADTGGVYGGGAFDQFTPESYCYPAPTAPSSRGNQP